VDALLGELEAMKAADVDWRGGKVFSLVYHAGAEHERLLQRAHAAFASANLLNPLAFKSLKRMESEIVGMAASLMHGPPATVGAVTSGGTESILVAVAAYRDRARRERPWLRRPELVVPVTLHPAFDKAAHYFGVRLVKVGVDAAQRVDVAAMAKAITRRTIGLCASAPQYPHGVVDPIAAIGALAVEHKLPFHVDACVGGFMLPWLEKLGRPVPTWDFRVPGVTSISADLHKFAYAGKGASVLLWRSMDAMQHQFFIATDYPGGIYASPTVIGTRPGGPIAAAWAALQGLGEDGDLELARAALAAAERIATGIAAIPGLRLVTRPDATIVAWTAEAGGPDVFAIADRLEARGWAVDRQHRPTSIHLTCTANHAAIVDAYLADVAAAVAEVRADPSLARGGTAPMYGMAAAVPVRGLVEANLRGVMAAMYAPGVVAPAPAPPGGLVGTILDRFGPQLQGAFATVERVRARWPRALGGTR
jgi:glutamate/tyrosine decarboxylase-like PLP-dependent enzyme